MILVLLIVIRGEIDKTATLNACMATYEELCAGNGDEDRNANLNGFIISSEAIVRMQSAAWEEDIEDDYADKMCNGNQMACP